MVMRSIRIKNLTQPQHKPIEAVYCDRFFCRLRGLMFCPHLDSHQGLLLVEQVQSRLNAAIHMLFMRIDLAVVWINRDMTVVDVQYARRWQLSYTPIAPACYILETHPDRLADFHPGDKVIFEKV